MSSYKVKDNASSEVQRDQQPENWSKFSFLLRIFLPLAGLVLLFKQKHIFSRLLLQLDRNCVSVFCPSFSRREKLLKWAGSRLPETWSSQSRTLAGGVAELWSDGSLLCTLINSAIPGACLNPHRHWKKPPLHAQAIAYKYLGVIPIFTESDLNTKLTISLERSFLHYLNELQQAITRLTEKNETPKSVSMHYIARGMGLYTGEQHRKTVFYVYPNKNTVGRNSNIILHIRGPYATYGKAIIPKFHNDLFTTPEINVTTDLLATNTLVNGKMTKPRNSFMKSFSLPFMQYHKKHLGDNIIIDVTMEDDRAKVTYIPKNYGMYEILMVSNGELIRGCPFHVHISNNGSGIEDSLDGEAGMEDIPSLRKRKVLSKTIDFIDEQVPFADVAKRYKRKEATSLEVATRSKAEGIVTKIEEEDEEESRLLDETDRGSVVTEESTETSLIQDDVSDDNDNIAKVNYADSQSIHKVVNNDASLRLQLKPTIESAIGNYNKNVLKTVCNDVAPSRKVEVHRVKIPEKFCGLQNDLRNEADAMKYIKNVINTSNRSRSVLKHDKNNTNYSQITDGSFSKAADGNNNCVASVNREEARCNPPKPVPERFLQNQKAFPVRNTSPICPNHIVPEVETEYIKMSVAERRKIFSRKIPLPSSTPNCSFPETESASGSCRNGRFKHLEGLSVLNYLGSLKKSDCSKNRESYPLYSTMSLPNISSGETQCSVKQRRSFWENLSTSSSSLSVNSEASSRKKLNEVERCKLIWKKPEETAVVSQQLKRDADISKSADDILSMTNVEQHVNQKKYKSVDNSLDTCTAMTIEERKRLLLKHNYEKEVKPKKQPPGVKYGSIKERAVENPVVKTVDENSKGVVFPSVSDRIRKYHSACNLLPKKIEVEASKTITDNKVVVAPVTQALPQPVKSHFRRAVKYFKNLEEKSLNKPKDCSRRHSLDVLRDRRRGGSLNLTNVKERFSISNLYLDVLGERRGSFKGAANRSALVEALATFSRRENYGLGNDEEDNIMYELFQKKAKTRKRRSIRSIFDIYY
ncbi:hypothetical protein NQ315_008685 [Exocentrus adspersus]|uniref:Uncharacterized protein n=1 Tax=Exocentrus adspersus TaxID=1586481 RepID=A0AAV8W6E4_9CUCU|nr:hypothetical protein NQ315_008685 [Exocentrus adspersus]